VRDKTLGYIHKCLATILLFAAGVEPTLASHAEATLIGQAEVNNSNDQRNLKKIVEEAQKLESQGMYEPAAEIWKRLLISTEKLVGPDHPYVDRFLVLLASNLSMQGKHTSAESFYRRSLAIREKTLGPDHPDVDLTLNNLAFSLSRNGDYAAAEPLYRRSLAIREKALGSMHTDVADTLVNLASLLRITGQYAEAEAPYRRSLKIYEKVHGPDHLDVAEVQGHLGFLLNKMGMYAEAASLLKRSLVVRDRILGPYHIEVAISLNNLGYALEKKGEYVEAESIYRRALAIHEKGLPSSHSDIVTSLNNLASLLSSKGQYSAAEALLRRSIMIQEKEVGPAHPTIAVSLSNLGVVLQSMGQYATSETFMRRSLAIREKALGLKHQDVAISLQSLASLLQDTGRFAESELLYRRSIIVFKEILGNDHPDVAIVQNNRAVLLSTMGQKAAAEALYRDSIRISEKALGLNHPEVAASLSNLAVVLSDQGHDSAAESVLRRALAIQETAHGAAHPSLAITLSNLGNILRRMSQYDESEKLYKRSLGITEQSLGPVNINTAWTLNSLGILHWLKGQPTAAEAFLRRSLEIHDKLFGLDHIARVAILKNLANSLIDQKKFGQALSILKRSHLIEGEWVRKNVPRLSVEARSTQFKSLDENGQMEFELVTKYPDSIQLAMETRLNRKGLLLEIEQRQSLLFKSPRTDQSKVSRLQAIIKQLASATLASERYTALKEERNLLQIELYRMIPELKIPFVTPNDVAKALPRDGVLVEFQRYSPTARLGVIKDKAITGRVKTEDQYIALVLKPNGNISYVPLGPAAAIESTIQQGLIASSEGLTDADAIWAQLSNQVLKPLMPQLSDSRQWFLSPDGELNRVPFAALPAPQNSRTPLGTVVQIRVITTGRELLHLQQTPPPGSKAVVMANPRFDRVSAVPTQLGADRDDYGAQRRSSQPRRSGWKPLPATQLEGQQVANLLGSELISGVAATTATLDKLKGPRVLHIATHGDFAADMGTRPSERSPDSQTRPMESTAQQPKDPMLLSRLVLAGANQPDADPNDDGYLTAAEAVNLNLKGTELVVLSACSTGQGEVRTGEGVYGLQRSLTVAGARSTLLSLWKVDDAATAEFMSRYYKRLKAGEGRTDALVAVQNEFRSGIVKGPAGEDWRVPYYWAAWQLVGDWRPIKGL